VERVGVSKPTVIGWMKRYAAEGIGGLEDRPKPGQGRMINEVAVVSATLEPPPERLGVTHWSSRLLRTELGISHVWIGKIWRRWGLQPWRAETFKFSTDPELEAKVRDVVGLYLDPPDEAVVLGRPVRRQHRAPDLDPALEEGLQRPRVDQERTTQRPGDRDDRGYGLPLVTTDLHSSAEDLVARYASRWESNKPSPTHARSWCG